jgi:iron(III) transport system substrate-binding protein
MLRSTRWVFSICVSVSLLFTIACGSMTDSNNSASPEATSNADTNSTSPAEIDSAPLSGDLVVYSSRSEKFVVALLDKFQQETGVQVKALHLGEAAVNRIKEESNNVSADVFISNDIGALEHLRTGSFLQGYTPKGIETIDEKYRAQDMSWFGLSARTRVFMYNKALITEQEMPKTMWELTDPKWKGQFMIAHGGNGGVTGQVSALRYAWGDDKTLQWLQAIKSNAGAVVKGHGDIRLAVGSGEFKFGIVNNYYYHQQLLEPTNNQVGVIYPDQGQDGIGAIVNAAGVGFIKGAPHDANAKAFLDWLLRPENQREFSYASMEVPINPAIEKQEFAASITDYKTSEMPLSKLGDYFLDTKALIEKARLDLQIK